MENEDFNYQSIRVAAEELCTAVENYLGQRGGRLDVLNACGALRKELKKQPQPRGEVVTESIPRRRIPGIVSPPKTK